MILAKLLNNTESLFPNLNMRIIIDVISECDPWKEPSKGSSILLILNKHYLVLLKVMIIEIKIIIKLGIILDYMRECRFF